MQDSCSLRSGDVATLRMPRQTAIQDGVQYTIRSCLDDSNTTTIAANDTKRPIKYATFKEQMDAV